MRKKTRIRDHGPELNGRKPDAGGLRSALRVLVLAAVVGLLSTGVSSADKDAGNSPQVPATPKLDEARMAMGKWMETQQIISKERKDWQQGKEMLLSRLDLVKKEVATLEEKIKKAQADVAEANRKRDELVAENEQLKGVGTQLTTAVTGLEGEIQRLFKMLPKPVQDKIQPLYQRIPEDPSKTRVSVAERCQNVLGILNEVNKANGEITVGYDVQELADGKPAEVKTVYVGLAQAYYVSASGEAGSSHPTAGGWKWTPSKAIAREVLTTLEILQGKQTAEFVPLPVKMQ